MPPSFPGGGGVLLSDLGHAGVLFPLCPASKCLSGGISSLPPEPSVGQCALKGPFGPAYTHAILEAVGIFSRGGEMVGSGARADEQAYGRTVQG